MGQRSHVRSSQIAAGDDVEMLQMRRHTPELYAIAIFIYGARLTLMQQTSLFFRRLVGFQIVYLLFVIVFGAYVRVSGSGAGCGRHWPLCKGDILPEIGSSKTLIELSHRLTSGLSLVLCAVIFVIVLRRYRALRALKIAASFTMFFLCLEGLLGAALVLLEHVADNPSIYRAYSMGFHLINTYCLMASATLLWYFVQPHSMQQRTWRLSAWQIVGFLSLVCVSVTGALTALGDTLFPISQDANAFADVFEQGKHTLIRLRVFHPLIAVAGSLLVLFVVNRRDAQTSMQGRFVLFTSMLVFAQLFLGVVNIYLSAPLWMQLVHLLFAELVWMAYVLWVVSANSAHQAPPGFLCEESHH